MGQLEDYKLFATIVDQGSLGKAAEALNIAKSAASRRLKLLEERFGARLIERDPGQWSLTAFGREFYDRIQPMLDEFEQANDDFTTASQSLEGRLRVSCAYHFGIKFLLPTLLQFKQKYPEIDLTLDFDDRIVNLDSENYDLAIRIQQDPPSDHIISQLGTSERVICASSAYLEEHGTPTHPSELKNHQILNHGLQKLTKWHFSPATGKPISLELRPYLNSNDGIALLTAAKQNMGIARIPDFLCQKSFQDETLVRLLQDWNAAPLGIYLVSSNTRRFNKRMRVFVEEVMQTCLKELN